MVGALESLTGVDLRPPARKCDACGRMRYDCSHVALDVDGFHELACLLCNPCSSSVRDAVRDRLRELEPERAA